MAKEKLSNASIWDGLFTPGRIWGWVGGEKCFNIKPDVAVTGMNRVLLFFSRRVNLLVLSSIMSWIWGFLGEEEEEKG